jgi:hypothetical protein
MGKQFLCWSKRPYALHPSEPLSAPASGRIRGYRLDELLRGRETDADFIREITWASNT